MLMQESNKGSSQLESPGQGPERTKKARSVLVPTQAEKKKIHQNVAQPTGGALAEGNESGESETTSESESESDGGNDKNNSDNKNNNNQTKESKHKSRKNKDKETKTPTPEQLAKRRASAPSVDQGTKKTNAIEELRRGTALVMSYHFLCFFFVFFFVFLFFLGVVSCHATHFKKFCEFAKM